MPILFRWGMVGAGAVGVCLALSGAGISEASTEPSSTTSSLTTSATTTTVMEPPKTKLVFVGDVMLDRGVSQAVTTAGNGDWAFPFEKIRPMIKDADIAFGNLESIISDQGQRMKPWFLCCSFRAAPPALAGLQDTGFDVMSVANNHSGDFGRDAMADSASRLLTGGISPVGYGENDTAARKPALVSVGDTTFAYLAYNDKGSSQWRAKDKRSGFSLFASAGRSGIAWLKEETLVQDVVAAKAIADVVVVSMHTGTEYKTTPNPITERLARLAIDSGASVVVGHHPHVKQRVEYYSDGVIAYSLGNFVFDQNETTNPGVRDGLLLEVTFSGDELAAVVERPIRINDYSQPQKAQ